MTTPPSGSPDPYNQPPQYGQPQYGQPQYGQPQYGQPQYGEPQYGAFPAAPTYSAYGAPQTPFGAPAGMGNRLLARIIDGVIIGIPAGIVLGILIVNLVHHTTCTSDVNGFEHCSNSGGGAGVVVGYLIVILAALGYELYFIGVKGATIGKRIMGVKVLDSTTGRPIGVGRAFLRYLVLGVTGSICTLGYWSPFFDNTKRNQGWHDKAANDLVVVGK